MLSGQSSMYVESLMKWVERVKEYSLDMGIKEWRAKRWLVGSGGRTALLNPVVSSSFAPVRVVVKGQGVPVCSGTVSLCSAPFFDRQQGIDNRGRCQ